ncbi:MAG: HD domain-containing protein [Candidatus Njordarchaeia archaeon]
MSFDYLELTDEGLPYSIGVKTIKDPIHGYITVGKHEMQILDHPLFQRLRRIKQLQTAYLVYPGAEHSRFQHSLGVMHLSGKFALALVRNTVGYRGKRASENYIIPKMYNLEIDDARDLVSHLLAIRIAGMLHDVGHGPYAHAFDEQIVSKSERLRKRGINSHEDLGFQLLKLYFLDELKKGLGDIRYFINEDILESCLLYILAPREEKNKHKVTALCRGLRYVLREFLYPSDILDFTIRDSYYSGAKEFGMVDAMRLMMFSVLIMGENQIASKIDQVEMGPLIAPFDNALNTLRAFLYSRFWLFNNVYFHKISRVFDFAIKKVLEKVNECIDIESMILETLDGDLEKFNILDDLYILHKAKECKNEAWEWAKKILNREIPYREIYSGELHLSKIRNKEKPSRADVKPPQEPMKVVENIRSMVAEIIDVDPKKIVIDYPHLRFFPDNPYLPNKTFILLGRTVGDSLSVKNLSVSDVLFGTAIDMTVMRIFLESDLYKELNEHKIEKLAFELEESGLIDEFSLSLFYHWGNESIGVTM